MRFSISRRRPDEPSYGITTADSSHLSDITKRQRQYVYTMLFRIVAILVVVLVPGLTLLERAVLGLVATVIPYVAVVRANGGPDQSEAPTNLMIGAPRQTELPGADRSLAGSRRIDAEGEPTDDDAAAAAEEHPARDDAAQDSAADDDAAGTWRERGDESDGVRVEAVWADTRAEEHESADS